MKLTARDSVIATLAYSDIFNYPLTAKQLNYWLINRRYVEQKSLLKRLVNSQKIACLDNFYFLPLQGRNISIRRKGEVYSQRKWQIATATAGFLKVIPTIKLVGVTGGLAMNNVQKDDDIDLFLITAKGALWVSRLLAIVLVEILGKRRRPHDINFADKVCLNMFMSEEYLSVTSKERDLFAAHEVMQMAPLWERKGTYRKFLQANRWVEKFLPNAWKNKYQALGIKYQGKKNFLKSLILNTNTLILSFFEPLVRALQLWYMRRHRTSEVISAGVLRFHPRDARAWIKQKLAVRLGLYNIPLDKVFYGR